MELKDYELKAWAEYNDILAKYHKSHSVHCYDRVSIHKAFPEIKAAFEHCLAMATFRRLESSGVNE